MNELDKKVLEILAEQSPGYLIAPHATAFLFEGLSPGEVEESLLRLGQEGHVVNTQVTYEEEVRTPQFRTETIREPLFEQVWYEDKKPDDWPDPPDEIPEGMSPEDFEYPGHPDGGWHVNAPKLDPETGEHMFKEHEVFMPVTDDKGDHVHTVEMQPVTNEQGEEVVFDHGWSITDKGAKAAKANKPKISMHREPED